MLVCVGDVLVCSKDPKQALLELNKCFPFKPKLINLPKIYLGVKLIEVQLPNGVVAWSVSTSHYIKEAVKNVKLYLKKQDSSLSHGKNCYGYEFMDPKRR